MPYNFNDHNVCNHDKRTSIVNRQRLNIDENISYTTITKGKLYLWKHN